MKKKICILNYGLGNILSLKNAISHLGYKVFYFNPKNLDFDLLIIPGVGSFVKASKIFKQKKLVETIIKISREKKVLGICLGMQILMKKGYEIRASNGLGLIDGTVKKIKKNGKIKLPIVGYQSVRFDKKIKFLRKYNNKKFYFNHSYHAITKKKSNNLCYTKYKKNSYIAGLIKKNILGVQFHPEKSGETGLNFLKDVIENI